MAPKLGWFRRIYDRVPQACGARASSLEGKGDREPKPWRQPLAAILAEMPDVSSGINKREIDTI